MACVSLAPPAAATARRIALRHGDGRDLHLGRRTEGAAHVLVAGDTFDYRIIEHAISPRLGKGTQYRSFGKLLPIPAHYHAAFALRGCW